LLLPWHALGIGLEDEIHDGWQTKRVCGLGVQFGRNIMAHPDAGIICPQAVRIVFRSLFQIGDGEEKIAVLCRQIFEFQPLGTRREAFQEARSLLMHRQSDTLVIVAEIEGQCLLPTDNLKQLDALRPKTLREMLHGICLAFGEQFSFGYLFDRCR